MLNLTYYLQQILQFYTPQMPDRFQDLILLNQHQFFWPKAPDLIISSSEIRKKIQEGTDVGTQIPIKSWEYIKENNFYST